MSLLQMFSIYFQKHSHTISEKLDIFCSLSFMQFSEVCKAKSSLVTPPVDKSLKFIQTE